MPFPPFVDGDAFLSRAFVITKSLQSELASALRCFTLLDELAHAHLDMECQLGIDIGRRFEAEQPPESGPSRHAYFRAGASSAANTAAA